MAAATAAPPARWTYRRPTMYPKQEAAIFDSRRYSLIEASSKAGKTVACIVWLTEKAITEGKPGRIYWWVAPILKQAKIPFRRLLRRLPKGMFTANMSELSVTLANGAVIEFKGSDNPDSLYGEDVYAAVVDEASRCKEEAWYALRSTLTATRGPVRIIGNVKGKKNWFYRLARRAEKNDSAEYGYHKITAHDAVDAGVLAKDEIADAKSVLPEAVFRELFEAEAADDEGNPFGQKAIEECQVEYYSDRPVACWGWDLARKQDFTVGIGLDAQGYVAKFLRFQKPWPEQVEIIRRETGTLPAMVDATGVGDVVVGFLQSPVGRQSAMEQTAETGIVQISNEALGRSFTGTSIEGVVFTPKSKQMLMEGLAVTIQHHNVHYPKWADGVDIDTAENTDDINRHPLVLELESFEYTYSRTGVRYSAPDGEHDDCVCSLALATHCFNTRVAQLQIGDVDLEGLVEGFFGQSIWALGPESSGGGTWNLGF